MQNNCFMHIKAMTENRFAIPGIPLHIMHKLYKMHTKPANMGAHPCLHQYRGTAYPVPKHSLLFVGAIGPVCTADATYAYLGLLQCGYLAIPAISRARASAPNTYIPFIIKTYSHSLKCIFLVDRFSMLLSSNSDR